MPPKLKFQDGEKVFCYHGPLIYEAKCLRSGIKEKQLQYLIHYAGWNKNWDEWVPEDRVLKYNEANAQKHKELMKEQVHVKQKKTTTAKGQVRRSEGAKEKESNSRASTPISLPERTPSRASKSLGSIALPTPSHDSPVEPPRRKRGKPELAADADGALKTKLVINLSDDLKCHLIDECEAIKQKKLPVLPMSITIDKLLKNYTASIKNEKLEGLTKESAMEIANGIKEYFNASIYLQLLYKSERPQFEKMIPQDSEILPSSLYGPCYLLRLFVKLGNMMSYTTLDEKSTRLLLFHFTHLLNYLETNSDDIFSLKEYKDSSQSYAKKCQK